MSDYPYEAISDCEGRHMNRVDGIDINIYWSDLTREAKENIIYHLMVSGIQLSPMIKNDQKPFAWKSVDKDGD